MKFIFSNITYLKRKERKSTLFLVFIIVLSSFTDNIYLGIKRLVHKPQNESKSLKIVENEQSYSFNLLQKLEKQTVKKDTVYPKGEELSVNPLLEKPSIQENSHFEHKLSSNEPQDSIFKREKILPKEKFNPNDINEARLLEYGVSKFAAINLVKYKEYGGSFKIKSDLLKIYGFDSAQYSRIEHLIDLPEETTRKKFKAEDNYKKIDINLASNLDFRQFKGIGEVLSDRIIKYREKLGGFHDIHQVQEVYGIQDSVFQSISSYLDVSGPVQKLNINASSDWQLMQHPYISNKIAKIIVNYRIQNGQYFSGEDLLKINILDESWLNKVNPYLDF